MTKMLSEENVFQIISMCVDGRYPPMLKSCGLYPFHGALQVPTLMGVVASVCTPLPTRTQNSQRYRPNNIGSSCVRLLELTG